MNYVYIGFESLLLCSQSASVCPDSDCSPIIHLQVLHTGLLAAQRRAAAAKLPDAGLNARQLADLLKGDSPSKADSTRITVEADERELPINRHHDRPDNSSAMEAEERKREADQRAAVQARRMADEVERVSRQQQVFCWQGASISVIVLTSSHIPFLLLLSVGTIQALLMLCNAWVQRLGAMHHLHQDERRIARLPMLSCCE